MSTTNIAWRIKKSHLIERKGSFPVLINHQTLFISHVILNIIIILCLRSPCFRDLFRVVVECVILVPSFREDDWSQPPRTYNRQTHQETVPMVGGTGDNLCYILFHVIFLFCTFQHVLKKDTSDRKLLQESRINSAVFDRDKLEYLQYSRSTRLLLLWFCYRIMIKVFVFISFHLVNVHVSII